MRVIHYYPWGYCYPVTSGADQVACNQLNFFREKGYEVDCVVSNTSSKAWAADRFAEEFGWVNSVTRLDLHWSNHFRDLLFEYERARKDPAFTAITSRSADLFFSNYTFTAPLALETHSSCRRVVEMVDLLSVSFSQLEALEEGLAANKVLARAKQRILFDIELDLCHVFDQVITLSSTEYEAVYPHLRHRAVFVPQCVPDPGPLPESVAEEPDELLFVGSGYVPNVRGLDWFYRRVYLPYLHKQGVRLTVVGDVCNHVSFGEGHLVTKLPRVEGPLIDVYRRATVVIVPLFEGTGMSIKSIETLAMGCVLVTTPVGARGLPPNTDAMVQVDMSKDPSGTADVILNLLASPDRGRALRSAARALYEQHYHPDRYRLHLDLALGLN
jgi:glycosyltransferase involved in cell wall biosynthesis